jgi:hypothetical protein
MFKHYSNSVVEFFQDVEKFKKAREASGVTDKSIVEKHIPVLLSKVEKMTNQVDTILSNKALSLKIKVNCVLDPFSNNFSCSGKKLTRSGKSYENTIKRK